MTTGNDDGQPRDAMFAAAWSAFASDDARTTAPFALEARVRESALAACALRHANHRIARRQRILVALGTAATLVLVATGLLARRAAADKPPSAAQVTTESDVEHQVRALPTNQEARTDVETVPNGDSPIRASRPDALVTLAVDPVRETEQLALVLIRVTQDALWSLGIATNEPGATGLVDVEVLVGGDGLPRDIRSMRTVLTDEERDSRD